MTTNPPRDTLELLEMNPGLFHSLKYFQESEKKPLKKTVILGLPRSGTTLLARLLECACMSKCVGDKQDSYYSGLLDIYHNIRDNKGQYTSYAEAERLNIFADESRAYDSREREMLNFSYVASQLLFANTFRSGYMKSTQIGFGNDLLVPFVEMVRDVFQDHDLTIVFMKRDIQDAASSLVNHHSNELTGEAMPTVVALYERQLEQMKEASELGDVHIKYEDFVKDPIPFLRRSNPLYAPNEAAVKRILEKILR